MNIYWKLPGSPRTYPGSSLPHVAFKEEIPGTDGDTRYRFWNELSPDEAKERGAKRYTKNTAPEGYKVTAYSEPIEEAPGDFVIEPVEQVFLKEEVVAKHMASINKKRKAVEESGVVVNNILYATDVKGSIRWEQLRKLFEADETFVKTNWIGRDPDSLAPISHSIDKTLFDAIDAAGQAHIEACFDRQAELNNLLLTMPSDTAEEQAALIAFEDLNTGWPGLE